jgi:serine/threonine-protein kinase
MLLTRRFAIIGLSLILLVACNRSIPVEITDLKTYQGNANLFSVDVPTNWTIKDNSKPGEAVLSWTDPAQNAMVIVDVFEKEDKLPQAQLSSLLEKFLTGLFKDQPNFKLTPNNEPDGGVKFVWGYTAKADNGMNIDLTGNSFIKQQANKISILTVAYPKEQTDRLKAKIDSIINSFKVNSDAKIS